ncbi:MFS transporter [Desertibacillus haloalkaliphilus]|uniref:MFS transporter n=1 Tax=Desertibacillus haloalkaliphilus TaxID=1328930 RepID=UPI001C260E61|nr:MFS transporter [Desertibacillus haloalkaliphilus]MBU8905372.1 MFS transporter [Desertibacillus haloalkaliphilus]
MNERLWTKEFVAISLCNFFLFLGFYYLLVTLPIYTLQELDGNETQAGLMVTVFLITTIIARPLAGKWGFVIGNRKLLTIGMMIFTVSSALYLLFDSIAGVLAVRLLHGIGFGLATTATGAIVSQVIPDSRKGEGMGYYSLSLNLAVVLGPFLGLIAVQWGKMMLFSIVLLGSILAIAMSFLLSKESALQLSEKPHPEPESTPTAPKKSTLIESSAIKISIVAAFFAIIYSSILSFVPVHAKEVGLLTVSSYFFVVYAAVMLLSRPFAGRWLDQYGANVIVYPCIIFFAVGLFLLSISQTALVFLLAAAFIGIGWGTLFPTFQTISVQKATPERRGVAMATYLSIFELGVGFGSFIVGVVVAQTSLQAFYFAGAFIVLFGIAVYALMHGRSVLQEPRQGLTKES